MQKQQYKKMTKQMSPKPPIIRNVVVAFVVGGLICVFGQFVQNILLTHFNFTPETVGAPTVAVLIFIASLLTGLGVYDRIGQFAGAGSAVPVTGFANAMTSAALEHRSEGLVLGVGGNMFKLAGSVIVFGVVAAFFIALIKTLWGMM
ncbi:stage V sporulation protein AC [Desulfuribacillus alkaliarsenatis]|uniref:Stage V sporulation protein AC n=1 Tax=Desulfuribacillus alkaliarsenatis TaxID=766136 RepID=A0A1E5G6F2_9FIRM|nr:stage V sporulation protein AC [Desulfuribacillus alkaliarsenatis]